MRLGKIMCVDVICIAQSDLTEWGESLSVLPLEASNL